MNKSEVIAMFLALAAAIGTGGDSLCQKSEAKHGAAKQEDALNESQVKKWAQQLGHPNFRKREEASQKLKNGGLPATAALIQVIGDDPEVNLRAIQLLNHLFKGGYPPDEDVTVEALYELACQGSPAVYEWAMDVLARRYQDGDGNTKQSLEKGVLQNLSKSRNKDVANMAQEILYPFPSDVQTEGKNGVRLHFLDRLTSVAALSPKMDIETAHNKLEYNFSSSGALLTIKDLHDLALTFAYSGGLLSTVTEPGGNVYSFAYSGGQASTITRLGNLTTTLTVDGSGDLTVIENADGGLRSFVYDPSRL